MKKSFICSLCHNGILGGALYLDETAIAYKTNKLTVNKMYRDLVLPLEEISELTWRWILFPVAIFRMRNGTEFKFIIFNKRRFNKYYKIKKQINGS